MIDKLTDSRATAEMMRISFSPTSLSIFLYQSDGLVGVVAEVQGQGGPSMREGSNDRPHPMYLPLEHVDFKDNHVYFGVSSRGSIPEV